MYLREALRRRVHFRIVNNMTSHQRYQICPAFISSLHELRDNVSEEFIRRRRIARHIQLESKPSWDDQSCQRAEEIRREQNIRMTVDFFDELFVFFCVQRVT